jgi:AraC-like DNA-binding protein
MRHGYEPKVGVSVSSLVHDYPAEWQVPEHSHRADQLIFATSGVMEIRISETHLLVPPLFAVWVSAQTRHSIRMPSAVSMRTLYLRPKLVQSRNCHVLHVSPFLRELILEITRTVNLLTRRRDHAALRDVLIAQITKAAPIPTTLILPVDPRARRLAEETLVKPAGLGKLGARCRDFGMSVRTLQRIFARELGVDFDSWRRQARLLKSVELLTSGTSVQVAAAAVGYRQASTFIAVFSRQFGLTPRTWIAMNYSKLAKTKGM